VDVFKNRNGDEESGDTGDVGIDPDGADVFSLAPFKLAPKKKKKPAHVIADGVSEKRRIHRYENLPAPQDHLPYSIPDHLVSNSVYSTPSPEDLFGLVPFTAALTPRWNANDPLRGQTPTHCDYLIMIHFWISY